MRLALTDKVIKKYMDEKGITDFLDCSNESEGLSIAAGYWLATGKRAEVYISGDGFMNCLNFFTSWIMVEPIEMNIFISTGRTEPPHKVVTEILPELLELLNYDSTRISIQLINK